MKKRKEHRNVRKRVRIRELRIARNLTQRQVAFELHVTENHIRHIENGYVDPSARMMFRIAKYFESNVYELFPDLVEDSVV